MPRWCRGPSEDRRGHVSWQPPGDTDGVTQSAAGGLALLVVLGVASVWVLTDARSRAERGRPVVMTFSGVSVDRPEVWAALCLVVVVVFLPLYLTARSAD